MAVLIPRANRFDSFDVYRTYYKKIKNHEIEVGILIPKDLKPGLHPVFVKFHGGGCVSGTWSYPDWFANWLVPLVHRNNAIVVSPNYRLLPEHTGNDIQADLADFWTWFKNGGVTTHLATLNIPLSLDYTRVLAGGDSAGGYLALQSGLTQPPDTIAALLGCYPMTTYLRRAQMPLFMGEPSPPASIIDAHVAALAPGTVISGALPRPRNRISYALFAYGRYKEFFGEGEHLWPISILSAASPPEVMPPAVILHGDKDTAVSIEDSRAFVEKVREVFGEGFEVRLVEREGVDHGFDMDVSEGEEWVRDVVRWVEERWIR
ncbi:alpha/beta-hydrolase [Bimuria novae-zelandiae CBS 107.79]|uniref:Alpha/beta-hydrolase n=1 Tax=Bimuria novae-zelandiae CBS 107.79 TaxID=1447943 RepID=A0A6A5VXM1_9PLEO|nr:alpha/beta-hydrolase [Bimuria novae-zelandiae CBS 107.79]